MGWWVTLGEPSFDLFEEKQVYHKANENYQIILLI